MDDASLELDPQTKSENDVAAKLKRLIAEQQTEHIESSIAQMTTEQFYKRLKFLEIMGDPDVIIHDIGSIVDRFALEMEKGESMTYPERDICRDIGWELHLTLWSLASQDIHLEDREGREKLAQALEKMYGYIDSESKLLRHYTLEAMSEVMVLDWQNHELGLSHDLHNRFAQDTVAKLVHPQRPYDNETAFHMMEVAWSRGSLDRLFIPAMRAVEDTQTTRRVFSMFANRLGDQDCLKLMRIEAAEDGEFRNKMNTIYKQLDLIPEEAVATDVKELYDEKFDISHWKPNDEALKFDLDFIARHSGNAGRYLDIACGSGRHMAELEKQGKFVAGVDLSVTNIRSIHRQNPRSRAAVASWHHIPFEKHSFDAAYCIGRSFQHNATLEDVQIALREAYNMLNDNGVLLIDSASTEMGYVGEKSQEYAQKMDKLGVLYTEPGMMVGSPNNKDYVERWVPSPDAFKKLALSVGFVVEEVEEQSYTDHHGQKNVNYYYKLAKRQPPMSFDELIEASRNLMQSGPPLFVTYL